jgi:tetratricopeptide (TPR) repeat protein
MGLIDPARRALSPALALASLLAGCGHLPVLIVPRDPLSAEEHARLGASYEAQGLRREAGEQYGAAVRKDPAYASGWMAYGNFSFDGGDLKNAENSFRRVLKLSPRHAAADNNLAMVYLAQGVKLDEAERLAREALAQEGPLKPYILDTLANVDLKRKRCSEARADLDQAQAAAPPGDAAVLKRLDETRAQVDAASAPGP